MSPNKSELKTYDLQQSIKFERQTGYNTQMTNLTINPSSIEQEVKIISKDTTQNQSPPNDPELGNQRPYGISQDTISNGVV